MSQEGNIPTTESGAAANERGILCVEDVLSSPAPLNAAVGDLFFTTKGIYFIPYGQFLHTGSFGGFASALVGGLTMAFTTSTTDKWRLEGALRSAKEHRTADYGLPCAERQSKHWVFLCREKESRLLSSSRQTGEFSLRTPSAKSSAIRPFQANWKLHFLHMCQANPLGIDGVDVQLPSTAEMIATCKNPEFHPPTSSVAWPKPFGVGPDDVFAEHFPAG